MTARHLMWRFPGRLGARFQWERRVPRDRLGVIWVTYVLKAWGPAGYRTVSLSLSPRTTRAEWAGHVRGLRERLRYLLARDATGMTYAKFDAGPQFTHDRPCSHTKPSR